MRNHIHACYISMHAIERWETRKNSENQPCVTCFVETFVTPGLIPGLYMQSRHMQTIYKRRCYCAMNIWILPKNVNNNCTESNISVPPKTKQRERDREKPNSYT